MVPDGFADDGFEVGDGAGDGMRGWLAWLDSGGADGKLQLGPYARVFEGVVEEGAHGDGCGVGAGDYCFFFCQHLLSVSGKDSI